MTITQTITALPSAPDPATDSPSVFSTKAAASVIAQRGLPTELNAFATQANALAVAANENAVTAASAASAASVAANTAVVTSGATLWVTGTTYALGATVIAPSNVRTFRKRTASSVSSVDPASDPTNWLDITTALTKRSTRTANSILVSGDNASIVDITAGTFTQTFTAAATLGDGWSCFYRNSGTGDITLDPNGAELIDGLSSYIMYPGESRLIQCNGTGFTSIVLSPFSKTFTASGTWTKPPGYRTCGGIAWSGGNSGERTGAASVSIGGGGGGCWPFVLNAADLGATETVTIGAGGAAVTTVAVGNVGGNTSFGSWFTVWAPSDFRYGGAIGVTSPIQGSVSAFGFEASNFSATPANSIYGGTAPSNNATVASSSSLYGGAAGGSSTGGIVRAAGTSKFGGNGGAAGVSTSGTDGTAPGGGGGATSTGTTSGAGARGELRIWGIA